MTLKCIKCGKEAEYVVNGNSFCSEDLPSPAQGIINKNEQKPVPFIQPESPLEPKREDIHAQASLVPLTAEVKATGKIEIPTKPHWSHYLIRTPIKDHWNYYLIIALLIVSVILFALYFISA